MTDFDFDKEIRQIMRIAIKTKELELAVSAIKSAIKIELDKLYDNGYPDPETVEMFKKDLEHNLGVGE